MPSELQTMRLPLGTQAFTASGKPAIFPVNVPPIIGDRFAHIVSIDMVVSSTPTLGAGTLTVEENQLAVTKFGVKLGVDQPYEGNFTELRLFEALERAALPPEHDDAATTELVTFARRWNAGPPRMKNAPKDWAFPAGLFMGGGGLQFEFNALASIDAQLTALTYSIRCYANVILLPYIQIPPLVVRKGYTVAGETSFGGIGKWLFIGLCKTNAFPVIAAADYTDIAIKGTRVPTDAVPLPDLEQLFHYDMGVNVFSQVHGEVLAATTDNPKKQNGTALASATSVMSPVAWMPPDAPLSSCIHETFGAGAGLSMKYSGTGGGNSAYFLTTKVKPRPGQETARYVDLIQSTLGNGKKLGVGQVVGFDGRPYRGTEGQYMPIRYNLA
jgi:hypothetical protein